MNAKLLYAATVGLALASSFAWADPARSLSRDEVVAQYNQALASHTLRKTDYDYDLADRAVTPSLSRAEVVAELARARTATPLQGPLRSRSYNPYGRELLQASDVTRAEVKADVLLARQDGTLHRTEHDDDQVFAARPASRVARPILATAPRTAKIGS